MIITIIIIIIITLECLFLICDGYTMLMKKGCIRWDNEQNYSVLIHGKEMNMYMHCTCLYL